MKNQPLRKAILALAVIAVLIFFNYHLTDHFIERQTVSLFSRPLSAVCTRLSQWKLIIVSFFRVENIILENINLTEENRHLRAENLKINDLTKENDFLRSELGIAKKRGYQLEAAKIFQFNANGLFRTALIDKGTNDNVAAGQAVIFNGDIILGVVQEVYPDRALVFLINDPRVTLNVKLADDSLFGRTRGGLEKGLFMEMVTNQEEIEEGQEIVTSGLDGLPDLLMVGQVANVQLKSGELFKTVRIKPFFGNLFLKNVFVLRGQKILRK